MEVLIVVIPVMISSIAQVIVEYRRDPAFATTTFKWFGLYLLHLAAGIAPVIYLAGRSHGGPPMKAVAAGLFALAWVAYGALWLTRVVPRHKELPAWLGERANAIDYTLLGSALLLLIYCLI